MICRSKERGEAALSEIKSKTGNQNVHLEVVLFQPPFTTACGFYNKSDIKIEFMLASRCP